VARASRPCESKLTGEDARAHYSREPPTIPISSCVQGANLLGEFSPLILSSIFIEEGKFGAGIKLRPPPALKPSKLELFPKRK
jgi:hypothetical protein